VANVFMRIGTEWDGYRGRTRPGDRRREQVAARGWYSGTYKQTGKSFRARFIHVRNLSCQETAKAPHGILPARRNAI
jgi:uncharacterized protein